ncbi:MAG: response regulator [Bdellovibrionota bacterium]
MNAKKVILVVDDDIEIRECFSDILGAAGYTVQVAQHGKAALELLRTEERPSLIFLDVMMPVMNGKEFLAALKLEVGFESIPVVVTTASMVSNHLEGARSVLKKPLDIDDLLATASYYCVA